MATRGRKPDAPALRVIKGTDRPGDREEIDALPPLGGPPSDWKPLLKALWHEIAEAIPHGVAGKSDRLLVELACVLVAKMRIDPAEMTPALASQIRTALGELAMTPTTRARLASPITTPSWVSHYLDT